MSGIQYPSLTKWQYAIKAYTNFKSEENETELYNAFREVLEDCRTESDVPLDNMLFESEGETLLDALAEGLACMPKTLRTLEIFGETLNELPEQKGPLFDICSEEMRGIFQQLLQEVYLEDGARSETFSCDAGYFETLGNAAKVMPKTFETLKFLSDQSEKSNAERTPLYNFFAENMLITISEGLRDKTTALGFYKAAENKKIGRIIDNIGYIAHNITSGIDNYEALRDEACGKLVSIQSTFKNGLLTPGEFTRKVQQYKLK